MHSSDKNVEIRQVTGRVGPGAPASRGVPGLPRTAMDARCAEHVTDTAAGASQSDGCVRRLRPRIGGPTCLDVLRTATGARSVREPPDYRPQRRRRRGERRETAGDQQGRGGGRIRNRVRPWAEQLERVGWTAVAGLAGWGCRIFSRRPPTGLPEQMGGRIIKPRPASLVVKHVGRHGPLGSLTAVADPTVPAAPSAPLLAGSGASRFPRRAPRYPDERVRTAPRAQSRSPSRFRRRPHALRQCTPPRRDRSAPCSADFTRREWQREMGRASLRNRFRRVFCPLYTATPSLRPVIYPLPVTRDRYAIR